MSKMMLGTFYYIIFAHFGNGKSNPIFAQCAPSGARSGLKILKAGAPGTGDLCSLFSPGSGDFSKAPYLRICDLKLKIIYLLGSFYKGIPSIENTSVAP